jgi:S1-C subfamily serine protease
VNLPLNLFDLLALFVLIAAVVAGTRTGALPQIGGIAGAVACLLVMLNVASWLVEVTVSLEPLPRALLVLGAILGSVVLGEAAGSAIGRALAGSVADTVLNNADRVAGGVVGAAQALLIIWLAGGLLAAGPIPAFGRAASQSFSLRYLEHFLPPATDVIGQVAGILDSSGLPAVFVGLEPIPLAPVDTPTSPQAQKIAAGAIPSTGRVVSQACTAQVTGTGVIIAAHYMVTNAHVVAGATVTEVSIGSKSYPATTVAFDPKLDIAVLYLPKLTGTVLSFATSDPPRGTVGASIGFPGGGPMVVTPAGVSGSYTATGRDIYGKSRVDRVILELRAAIEPGDSGGPLVLADGTVGGLVFAQSKTDPAVGYALTPTSVEASVAPSIGRTTAVSTGVCIH